MTISLVINTFDQPDYLRRVLHAVSRQSISPDEVLLADDGSTDETKIVFEQWREAQSFRCEHVWQEHQGFRRARVLNQAIARSRSRYLVFLDGDTLPHPKFLADHRAIARPARFIQGHRTLVESKAATWFGLQDLSADRRRALWQGQLRGVKNAYRWPFPWRSEKDHLRGIRGCNLAIWREDLVRVNGYNEDFVGWGREDSELAARLMNAGVRRLDVRGWVLCYHLWHAPVKRSNLPANDELLAKTVRDTAARCRTGLDGHQ